jgi:hypothetical protein
MDDQLRWFPRFSKLPLELRDQIWEHAFPEPRVFEVLDSPYAPKSTRSASNRLMFADIRNEPPPAIARVCRDARQAVLRRYKPLVLCETVKHVHLARDIILLDSYLQVKRLLKVVRLLSQVEPIRKHATTLALGTSWGLHTGLHLRLFHRSIQTKQSLVKFLEYIAKFKQLRNLVLVVYQQSDLGFGFEPPDLHARSLTSPSMPIPYPPTMNARFALSNMILRRPSHSVLELRNHWIDDTDLDEAPLAPAKDAATREPEPRHQQIQDLKETFEWWLKKLTEEGQLTDMELLNVKTAKLAWKYSRPSASGHG